MNYLEPCQYSIRLTEKLKSLDTQNVLDFELINKAIYWARKYHGDQKRKSGEPYYSHPLEVAYMISEYKLKTWLISPLIWLVHGVSQPNRQEREFLVTN